MASVTWSIKGPSFSNCSCDWGCPCQFNAVPTNGHCHAFVAMRIDEGQFDGIDLGGVRWAGTFRWPGPIHQGNGAAQAIIDKNANDKQRNAIGMILSGQHTDPGATIFQVFSAMITTMHDPLFLPIDFSCDVDKRTAKVHIDGVVDSKGGPILNPVTGQEHRVSIKMTGGFEYNEAEVGTGTTRANGAVDLNFKDTHSHYAIYHMTNKGVVR